MLPVKSRLRRSEDIRSVLRSGKRIRLKSCTVSVVTKGRDIPARVGVVVGKSVSKSAVRRHRIQRLFRSISVSLLRDYPRGYDMVVVALPAASRAAGLADIRSEWDPVAKAIGKLTL